MPLNRATILHGTDNNGPFWKMSHLAHWTATAETEVEAHRQVEEHLLLCQMGLYDQVSP